MAVSVVSSRGISARRRRSMAIAVSAAVSLVALTGSGASAQSTVTVVTGVGQGTVSGNAFMPGDITVVAGDSVTFSIGSDEGHTITFGTGPADAPPPFWPVSGFEALPEGEAPPLDMGTASIDDSPFINTGIVGKGTSATIEFATAGTYPFYCAIHPGMSGQVTVVDEGATTTQAEADAAVEATSADLLAQVEPIHQARLDSVTTVDNADGTQTWNVFADASTTVVPMAGGGSGYLELLQFTPDAIRIEPGDTISWTAAQIHTVTFLPEGVDPATLFTSEEVALSPMGGSTYDGTEPASSGVLNFPLGPDMPAVTEYALTFPEPGVYPFFCVLHAELGQIGVVAVGVDLPDISA
jgi:plastocyanin